MTSPRTGPSRFANSAFPPDPSKHPEPTSTPTGRAQTQIAGASTSQAAGLSYGDNTQRAILGASSSSGSHKNANPLLEAWKVLRKTLTVFTTALTTKMNADPACYYVNQEDVEHTVTKLRCPAKGIVKTTPWRDPEVAINSNLNATEFTFESPTASAATPSKTYIAAQSPRPKKDDLDGFFACEKFLNKAIESRMGLFQFVSPSTSEKPGYISKRSIIGQLQEQYQHANDRNEVLTLGNRYTVNSIGPKKTIFSDGESEDSDSHFILEVIDTRGDSDEDKKPISIVLTQAQVSFDNKLLSDTSLRHAAELMESHDNIGGVEKKGSMIISHAGIGRNATLITYLEMKERIKNKSLTTPEAIQETLKQLIEDGRKARGPHFIHSDAQIDILRKTLLEDFALPFQINTANQRIENRVLVEKTGPVSQLPIGATMPNASKDIVVAALKDLFHLQDNTAGGDCLFHSLDGVVVVSVDGESRKLEKKDVIKVRNAIADITAKQALPPDPEDAKRRLESNANDYTQVRLSKPFLGLPDLVKDGELSNKDFSLLQRTPGCPSSDNEIIQWQKLKLNKNAPVIVFDIGTDTPLIKTFNVNGTIKIQKIKNLGTDADEIRQTIEDRYGELARASNNSSNADQPCRVLLLGNQHFQRITGFTNPEDRQKMNKQKNENIATEADVQRRLNEKYPNTIPTPEQINEAIEYVSSQKK